ncbi:MAG: TetR/AcrR family transcriptional regulator, partial [Oscillospiraceae bacterium]
NIIEDKIVEMSMRLFLYILHDDKVRKFRKMLAIEQYSNKELAAQYAKQYIDMPVSYQSASFGLMVEAGAALPESAQVMALQYYAPVYLYITLCDCRPKREAEAKQALEQHFRQFIRLYVKKGDSAS